MRWQCRDGAWKNDCSYEDKIVDDNDDDDDDDDNDDDDDDDDDDDADADDDDSDSGYYEDHVNA